MAEQASTSDDLMPEAMRQRLTNLRRALLRLHKAMLDAERESYERAHGAR